MKLSDIKQGSPIVKEIEVTKNSLDALNTGVDGAKDLFQKEVANLARANVALAAISGALSIAGFVVSS
jgi:hypothetical protein